MMKKALFNDDSGSEEDSKLQVTTNKDYAKSYNKFRQKELLQKLKDRDQNFYDDSDSSSEEESSEDEETTDPKFDEEFFKTLSFLKSKDPKIYSNEVEFFEKTNKKLDEDENEEDTDKNKKSKALTIRDYERKVMVEKGGVYEDDDSDIDEQRPQSPTIAEEERRLKDELKNALKDDDEDEEWGGIFKKRNQTREEKDKEEATYTKWLAGQSSSDIGEDGKVLKPLKEFWDNPKISREEAFLRDYILNNGYQTKDDDEIPTYNEIVALSDDEKDLDSQAEFEHKFNFRFEDPDQEFIKRYPRTIEQSVRRTDDKRKEKRVETRERKLKEKEQRRQDLEVLKEMKRQEIEEKIQKLKAVAGNEEIPFANDDLDEDFDPEAHDKKMRELFNDEYYQVNEGDDKPELPDDLDELKVENWDNFDPAKEDEDDDDGVPHCEDPDFVMDCDYDPEEAKTLADEMIENTKGKRKRKRKSKFIEVLRKDKPTFDPEDEKTYAEYIDEYYKLDYEDMIGDLPCRFRYVETVPNDYGLTIEEILLAKNKELNQWASLKKAVQVRPAQVEHHEVALFKRKAQNETLKKKIFKSIYGPDSEEEADEKAEKEAQEAEAAKNKKRRKRKRKTSTSDATSEDKKVKVSEGTGEIGNPEKSDNESPMVKLESDKPKALKPKSNLEKIKEGSETVKETSETVQSVKKLVKVSPKVAKLEDSKKKSVTKPAKTNLVTIKSKKSTNNKVKTFTKSKPFQNTNGKGPKNKFQKKLTNKTIKIGFSKDKKGGQDISENRLRAFGINPKQFQNHLKYGNKKQQANQQTKDSQPKKQQKKTSKSDK